MSLITNLFSRPKPQRPYLKVCTKCHGKGQLSYFDNQADKRYALCDKCASGSGLGVSLGVTLKCLCAKESSHYEYLRLEEVKYLKGLDKDVAHGLKAFQQRLGEKGVAVALMCDCGAHYLVDDIGSRKRIAGDKAHNEADKEHNKAIAEELAQRGIAQVLKPCKHPVVQ